MCFCITAPNIQAFWKANIFVKKIKIGTICLQWLIIVTVTFPHLAADLCKFANKT